VAVGLPNGQIIIVSLGSASHREPNEGWAALAADSPLMATDLDGPDHLAIRAALAVIGDVPTKHLARQAFGDGNTPYPDCGGSGWDD
jgi:hypothetical protein